MRSEFTCDSRELSESASAHDVETVIFIHVPSEYASTNYRWAHRALADLLPKNVGLICVNRPLDLFVAPMRHTAKFAKGIWTTRITWDGERLPVVTPRLLAHELLAHKIPGAYTINLKLMRSQLRRTMASLFPTACRMIHWIYAPPQHWIFNAFPDAGKVYHCYDEYTCTPDGTYRPWRWEREKEILKEADVTFVTADVLMEKRREFARRIALLPNGIPEFFFEKVSEDAERFDRFPAPRIVSVGNTCDFLMYDELHRVFSRRPEWQLVMIGPKRRMAGVALLDSLPNVSFVGTRPHETLPGILPQFQAGLVPFKLNDYTRGTQPLKVYAYLAAGIPVISTDLPALRPMNAVVRLVDDDDVAIEAAIAGVLGDTSAGSTERLRTEGRRHTWTSIYRNYALPILRDQFDL